MMTFTQRDLVRLHSGISGMTPKLLRQILQQAHDDAIPLADLFSLSAVDWQTKFHMPPKVAEALASSTDEQAEQTLAKLREKRFRLVTFLDEDYPPSLKRVDDAAPPLLYIHGDTALLRQPGIGFGGSRNVSRDGQRATDELARSAVKDHQATVVSGHAKGVDTIAHQSALAAGGVTILVLPEGALKFRLNNELRSYWAEAANRIVVVTQFAPNEPWATRNAMARNATVLGLSRAFCVIEAGDEQGGTWAAGITALRMGVPLYVLDYETLPESALGNKKLIERGGQPLKFQKEMTLPGKLDSSQGSAGDRNDNDQPEQLTLF